MQTRHNRQMTNRKVGYTGRSYIEGNTVKVIDPIKEMQKPVRKVNKAVRRNQDKALYMNLPYVMFLTAALVITGIVLIGYLQTQAQLTVSIKRVAALESELNDMRLSNDEQLARIESAVDIEKVKQIAIEELGMTYAKEGQVVTISGEGSDYVRQLADLPE